MATFDSVLQEIAAAAHAAGLLTGSGHVDMGQAESALVHALRRLSQTIDLDGFKVLADPLFTTQQGETHYALPDDFGRATRPDDEDDSGFFVYDSGGSPSPLRFMDAAAMLKRRTAQEARPTHFHIAKNKQMRLHPAPDAAYSVAGVYVPEITADSVSLFEDVDLPDHTYLRDAALAQMALELGHGRAKELAMLAEDSRIKITNEHLRQSQRFQHKYARWTRRHMRGSHF